MPATKRVLTLSLGGVLAICAVEAAVPLLPLRLQLVAKEEVHLQAVAALKQEHEAECASLSEQLHSDHALALEEREGQLSANAAEEMEKAQAMHAKSLDEKEKEKAHTLHRRYSPAVA